MTGAENWLMHHRYQKTTGTSLIVAIIIDYAFVFGVAIPRIVLLIDLVSRRHDTGAVEWVARHFCRHWIAPNKAAGFRDFHSTRSPFV